MARALRKKYAGAKYHVTNRGNGRERVFYRADDRERFLDQLRDALVKDSVVLYAYCLMPNHFHLFVETPAGNIDKFMGRLTTAYAMYFRYKHYRPGHCFQSRYKAPVVEGDDYIVRLTRYIHLNVVKTQACAGLSDEQKWERLLSYRWNSALGYLRAKDSEEYVDYRWLDLFGKRKRGAYGRYLRQMLSGQDEVLQEAMESSSYALGTEEFRAEVEEWVRREAEGRARAVDVSVPEEDPVGLRLIEDAVASYFEVSVDDLHTPRRRLGSANAVFVELACRLGRRSQREVADYLGGVSEHAVSKARRKFRQQLADDATLATSMADIVQTLTAKG